VAQRHTSKIWNYFSVACEDDIEAQSLQSEDSSSRI